MSNEMRPYRVDIPLSTTVNVYVMAKNADDAVDKGIDKANTDPRVWIESLSSIQPDESKIRTSFHASYIEHIDDKEAL